MLGQRLGGAWIVGAWRQANEACHLVTWPKAARLQGKVPTDGKKRKILLLN
jgi:hypothetical protein